VAGHRDHITVVYVSVRRRRLNRRQRTVSSLTNSCTQRSSMTGSASACSAQQTLVHSLPALPGEHINVPLPTPVPAAGVDLMTCLNTHSYKLVSSTVCARCVLPTHVTGASN